MILKKFQVIGAFFIFEGFLSIVVAGLTNSIIMFPSLVYGLCKFGFGIYIAICDDEDSNDWNYDVEEHKRQLKKLR